MAAMDLEELIRQRARVVAALEDRQLSPEERERGWKRYDEIEEAIQAYCRAEAAENVRNLREKAQ